MPTKNESKKPSSIKILRPPLSRTFDVPSRDDLLEVFQGDSVKLIFTGGGDTERMWVTITQSGKMDTWEGTLDNDPVLQGVEARIKYGDLIKFHPYDVIDIALHKRHDQQEDTLDQRSLKSSPVNKISKPWYKNPQIISNIIIGVLGAIATLVAATF